MWLHKRICIFALVIGLSVIDKQLSQLLNVQAFRYINEIDCFSIFTVNFANEKKIIYIDIPTEKSISQI